MQTSDIERPRFPLKADSGVSLSNHNLLLAHFAALVSGRSWPHTWACASALLQVLLWSPIASLLFCFGVPSEYVAQQKGDLYHTKLCSVLLMAIWNCRVSHVVTCGDDTLAHERR